MALRKVFWTPKAIESFEYTIEYIQEEWTDKEVKKFVSKVFKTINQIEKNPTMFVGSEQVNVRKAVVTKHNTIFYRIQTERIELLFIWDNRQDPKSLSI